MTGRLPFLVAAALALADPGATALAGEAGLSATSVVTETPANVFTRGSQDQAALDVAGATTWVVWRSVRQEAGSDGVYGRTFDALGRPTSHERRLNATLPGSQARPAVAALADGSGAWVTWQTTAATGSRIVLRRFGPGFEPAGPEIAVAAIGRGVASDPVATLNGSTVLVAWSWCASGRVPDCSIRARPFGQDGGAVGPELEISGGPADSLPTAVAVGDGRFVVAWARRAAGVPSGVFARWIRIGNAAAAELSGEVALASAVEVAAASIEPSLAGRADGGLVAGWLEPAEAGYDVRARRFLPGGEPSGEPFTVASAADGWTSGVAVEVADDGRFAVSYNQERGSGDEEALVRTYSSAGEPEGAARSVSGGRAGAQRLAVATGARRFAWSDSGPMAWAWNGAGEEDPSGVTLTSWAPAGLAVAEPVDLGPALPAPPVGSAEVAPIPPIWNPDFEPQAPLVAPTSGPDFGFEPILQTPWTPPDPEMAVGPAHLVFIANGRIATYDKLGNFVWDDEIENTFGFWGELGADNFVFDPEVAWDVHAGRFFAMANEDSDEGRPFFLLAVSKDAEPDDRDDWHKYRIDVGDFAGGSLFIDSPNLAVNAEFVFLTADFFGPDKYLMFVIDKASILEGGEPVFGHDLIVGQGQQSMGIPSIRSAGSTLYILQSTELPVNTEVILHAITDPLGTFERVTFPLTVPAYTFPADPPQAGTSVRPELFEPRFWSVMERDGSLWAVHHVDSRRARVRWYEIALDGWPAGGTPSLVQSGEIDPGPGISTFFPSIDVDAAGDAAITFSRSAAAEFISIWRAARTPTDPPGTFQEPVEVQTSANPHTSGRWGDYSGTEADPAVPGVLWGFHEFTNGTPSSWRTWTARYDLGVIFADGFESGDTGAWSVVENGP